MIDPRCDEAVFPTDLLLALIEIAPTRQVPAETLCRGLGFGVDDLRRPSTRVSYRQASLMIRRALTALPEVSLGLTLGASASLGAMGLIGHAMSMCRTLGEAIPLGFKHLLLAGAVGYQVELYVEQRRAWMELEHQFPDTDIQAFITEEAFASSFAYGRALTGGAFRLSQVDFMHPDRGHADYAQHIFGAPVKFGRAHNRLVMEKEQLLLPIPTHHPLGLQQALELLEDFSTRERAKDDLCIAVERAAFKTLAEGVTLERVAGSLNLSGRTLRRRLAANGMSFGGLVENVRKTRALSLLTHSDTAIEHIAAETGYRDVRSFRRALHRWTGMGPREFRNS